MGLLEGLDPLEEVRRQFQRLTGAAQPRLIEGSGECRDRLRLWMKESLVVRWQRVGEARWNPDLKAVMREKMRMDGGW